MMQIGVFAEHLDCRNHKTRALAAPPGTLASRIGRRGAKIALEIPAPVEYDSDVSPLGSAFRSQTAGLSNPIFDWMDNPRSPAKRKSPRPNKPTITEMVASMREKGEQAEFPVFRKQRNWDYAILKGPKGKGSILQIGNGNRNYSWELGGTLEDEGATQLKAKRMNDLDKVQSAKLREEMGLQTSGRFQLHRANRGDIHGTLQDGKVNLSILLKKDGKGWTIERKAKPKRPDPARALYERATLPIEKTAELAPFDKAFYPIYTPPGGSDLTSAGLAAGIGAAGGLGYHILDRIRNRGDVAIGGERYRTNPSLIKRMLIGAGIGAGTSVATNMGLRAFEPGHVPTALKPGDNPAPGYVEDPSTASGLREGMKRFFLPPGKMKEVIDQRMPQEQI